MAEIKSAIELAMERTKSLVIDPEEREAMAIRELESKIKAVLRRFSEEMIDSEDAARELSKIQADEVLKRAIILDNLLDEFDVNKNNERLFALFHAAGIDLPKSVQDEFETLIQAFREEVRAKETAIQNRIGDVLAGLNITGSAIEPNLTAWKEWHEEVERTSDSFKKRIGTLKDKVKATNKSI